MDVGVVGIGHGKFGRRDDVSVQELAFEPYVQAMDDANLDRKEIGATIIAASPVYMTQRSIAGPITEYLGLNPQPVWLTEAACASSAAAIRTAYAQIKSGLHDIVMVVGVQKMLENTTDEILKIMGRSGDVQWEAPFGTTFANYYAMYATAHMDKYDTKLDDLTDVAIKNHYYGSKNPLAMFKKEVSREKVDESRKVSSPLRLFDCCSNADGAVVLILANEEKSRQLSDTPVWLKGTGAASAPFSILSRDDLTAFSSVANAADQAYKMANITANDLDVAAVHDCFTIAEIMSYEDLGFTEKGKGGSFVEQAYLGARLPVNIDGGLKAKGHPLGATGASQIYGVVKQLRGEAGVIQVDGAEIGLTHNVGGHGQYAMVNIFSR